MSRQTIRANEVPSGPTRAGMYAAQMAVRERMSLVLVCICGHGFKAHSVGPREACGDCYCNGFAPQHPERCGCAQHARLHFLNRMVG